MHVQVVVDVDVVVNAAVYCVRVELAQSVVCMQVPNLGENDLCVSNVGSDGDCPMGLGCLNEVTRGCVVDGNSDSSSQGHSMDSLCLSGGLKSLVGHVWQVGM